MDKLQRIMLWAYEDGLEVIWAKRPEEIQKVGIHLLEPTYEDLINALTDAKLHGVTLIVVHSALTWYRHRQ